MSVERGVQSPILPGKRHRRFSGFFADYAIRMMAREFRAVRVTRGTRTVLSALDGTKTPVVVLLTHCSWWDPLTSLALARLLVPSRSIAAPMDRRELERFAFFRYLGVFGMNPDDPDVLGPLVSYMMDVFRREERPTLWITPQGSFADPRAPITLRPGASAIAAQACTDFGRCDVVVAAIEYAFWEDKRPEVLIHLSPCQTEFPTTSGWHRAATRSMRAAAADLAEAVIARDPARFEVLVGRDTPKIHPLYDAFLSVTGQRRALGKGRRSEAHA